MTIITTLVLALVVSLLTYDAEAAPFTVVFKNHCGPVVNDDWTCTNKYQNASQEQVFKQVAKALKNVGYKKHITIYSIDPKRPDRDAWLYGAWIVKSKVYFAADPGGCPNARKQLERVLRGKQ